jgi:cysteine-rich repeat protein
VISDVTFFEGGQPFLSGPTDCETMTLYLGSGTSLGYSATRISNSLCGDGVVDAGEECDDGNFVPNDGCNAACELPVCGNSVVEPGEECDDGNATNGDACDRNCTTPRCGNGEVAPSEECDDGNLDETDACHPSCELNTCGDGFTHVGVEQCDDGNSSDGDGCEANCLFTVCAGGTGIVRPRVTILTGREELGDEKLLVTGRLLFPPGSPAVLDPSSTGLQVVVESVAAPIFDLSHRTSPVPPSTPDACDPRADGWKGRPARGLFRYSNGSGSIDPPACTDGSANGLHGIRIVDRRERAGQIRFSFRAAGATIPEPGPTARLSVVLGASPGAGSGGACGRIDLVCSGWRKSIHCE